MKLNHFSLFSGIGGIDLAAEWAGFTTVGQCEFADFPRKVLEKHWPNVPRWRDVRDVTTESIRAAGIERIDLLSDGYPCQPFSVAGKRGGAEDDRFLWPEMFRIIQEVRPTWVLGENVAGHVSLGLDDVLSDLESIGYATQAFVIPACAVNAPHRRDRVFIVANASGERLQKRGRTKFEESDSKEKTRVESEPKRCGEDVADADGAGCKKQHIAREPKGQRHGTWGIASGRLQWSAEPDVGRVANGVPNRVDRLKALGNAVVPQQVYPILRAIWAIERGRLMRI